MASLVTLPRELIVLIAPEPAAARVLNRVCRELRDLTRGLFHRHVRAVSILRTDYYIYAPYGGGFMTIMCFPKDREIWEEGEGFSGDDSPFDIVPVENMGGLAATADNLSFVVIDGVVNVSVKQYTPTMLQFVGVPIERIYHTTGFYNNFNGADIAGCVCDGGSIVFATKIDNIWAICTTETPLHLLRGTTLALELVCANDW